MKIVLYLQLDLYIYPFQNLSLCFVLKIFLEFRKFQPQYSYKIYSYIKKRVYGRLSISHCRSRTDANYDIINLHRFYVVMAAFLIKVLIGNCVCIAL